MKKTGASQCSRLGHLGVLLRSHPSSARVCMRTVPGPPCNRCLGFAFLKPLAKAWKAEQTRRSGDAAIKRTLVPPLGGGIQAAIRALPFCNQKITLPSACYTASLGGLTGFAGLQLRCASIDHSSQLRFWRKPLCGKCSSDS